MKKDNSFMSLAGLGALLGLVAVALYMFLPAVVVNDTALKGFEATFGYTASESWGPFSISAQVLSFSTPLLLIVIFTVAAIALVLLSTMLPSKLVNILNAALFAIAAAFVFMTPSLVVIAEDASSVISRNDLSLPSEAIISGILFLVAAVSSGAGLLHRN